MKRYENLFNLMSKKYHGIKNIFFKNNIREGLENGTCVPGEVFNGTECVKEIKSVKMFLLMPIANCIVVSFISLLFAGVLFKIKSTPLALSKDGLTCTDIPLSEIFSKDPTNGIVHETVYTDKAKKQKFNKIVFPWLSKGLYPTKLEKNMGTLFKIPFYLTLIYSTPLWYKPISFIKKILYKQYNWGTIPEISKINKESWVKDLISIFIFTPILLFFIFPIVLLINLLIAVIITPIQAWAMFFLPIEKGFRTSWDDEEQNKLQRAGWGILNILRIIGCLMLFFIIGMGSAFIIMGLSFIWFLHLFTGAHESKRDGLKTILKTWGNIVWDYKYIWAMFAIAMWASNFSMYLKGPYNVINFVKEKERDMLPGMIVGAAIVLLGLQQAKFFNFLPKTPKHRGDCYPNCNPPAVSPDELGLTKKCPAKSTKISV